MNIIKMIVAAVALLLFTGCSSTNLNGFRTEWTGGWIKGNPFDAQTPGKIELGMGYGSVSIIPMARGQGAKFTAITYELFSGHPLFAEEITVYPLGQDAVLKLVSEPDSIIKIPWLLDIKAGEPTLTKVDIIPVKEPAK